MKILSVHEGVVPISSSIRNAWIDFCSMDCSIVAIVSDVVRDGEPVVGYGFNSNGRYSAGEILRRRILPRLLDAAPDACSTRPATWTRAGLGHHDAQREAGRARRALGRRRRGRHGAVRPGRQARRAAALPLDLSDRYGDGQPDDSVFVYAAGGYYAPGKGLRELQDEMRGFLDQGYRVVKMKIGGADLAEDLRRIEAVLEVLDGDGVPPGGRRQRHVRPGHRAGVRPGHRALRAVLVRGGRRPAGLRASTPRCASTTADRIATGENLFSLQDARNLIRYGGMRPDRDYIQVDPALSYGLTEYLRIQDMLKQHGWSSRRCIPHGGHQFSLHIAAALKLGGNESYPGEFQPTGGFADDAVVETARSGSTEIPGIGFEGKANFYQRPARAARLTDGPSSGGSA